MHDPKSVSIQDYIYDLPAERIAKYPLEERDASRLLVWRDGAIQEDTYRHIARHLPPDSWLFFNNTRVVQARLFFYNRHGGKIEIFCLEPPPGEEVATGMSAVGSVVWQCLVGGVSKWKTPEIWRKEGGVAIKAEQLQRLNDTFLIRLTWEPAHLSFAEVLDASGFMPIPPYLKRDTEALDLDRYQTVYAQEKGSVAAPTAGLHFTERVFNDLADCGIACHYLTLHVGAGTFKPVKSERMADHEMHYEHIDVPRQVIEQLAAKQSGQTVVAVGTTSLRTLESLYWLGALWLQQGLPQTDEMPEVTQWMPYEQHTSATLQEAMHRLLYYLDQTGESRLLARTGILIAPGYRLRVADALVTNFHQPESTLILLVAAVTGGQWRNIYDYALANDFRFLSYGDGSLLFAEKK